MGTRLQSRRRYSISADQGRVRTAARWVRDVAVRGAAAGAIHGLLGLGVSAALDFPDMFDRGVLPLWAIIGALVGLAVAFVVGVLTVPAVLHAERRGRWLRPVTVALPAVALVVVAMAIVPVQPLVGKGELDLGVLVEGLVWWHVGPACWAALVLYRLSGRWPEPH